MRRSLERCVLVVTPCNGAFHYRIRGESGYSIDLRDPFEEALGVLRHLAVEKGEKLRIYRVDVKEGREKLVELGEAQPTYWSLPVKRRRRTA